MLVSISISGLILYMLHALSTNMNHQSLVVSEANAKRLEQLKLLWAPAAPCRLELFSRLGGGWVGLIA